MDFNNLLSVSYNVKCDQNKLETVLKQLESKINKLDDSMKKIDDKFNILEIADKINEQRVQNFQNFTIQNLRLTVNQFTTLKMSLRTYLGSDYAKQQQKLEIQPKSKHINKHFQSRISAFQTQARQLSKRMSELKIQLISKTSHAQEQAQQIKGAVKKNTAHIRNIRDSIRQEINEQFEEYKKQLQKENQEFLNKKLQNIGEVVYKLASSQSLISQAALGKVGEAERRTSINNFLSNQPQSSSDVATKNDPCSISTLKHMQNISRMQKLTKMKQNQKVEDISNYEMVGKHHQNKSVLKKSQKVEQPQLINQLKQLKQTNSFKASQTLKPPTVVFNDGVSPRLSFNYNYAQPPESMQHAINQLKQQLLTLIRSQIIEFQVQLSSVLQKNEKIESDVTILKKDSKQVKQQFTIEQQNIQDAKHQIDNVKNSLYQTNEKSKQTQNKVLEQESKMSQLLLEIQQIKRDLSYQRTQETEDGQAKKFREVQNIKKSQIQGSSLNNSSIGHKGTSLQKNSIMIPLIKDDSIIIHRLNLLTEKLSKIQEKLKISNFTSQTSLPKIDSTSNIGHNKNGNTPTLDILRKDVLKTNEELNKTNERLMNLKKNLKELEGAHSLIPKKLETLQTKINNVNQLQQDRLLQLIKELINRVLTDPFNNHFTNGLKKQIHIKFLEIKHQYASIWKDIETKVTDRAEASQLQILKEKVQTQNLQIKALINKKAETQDFKKGIKYLETKVKDVYNYLKQKEDQQKNQQNKKYYMGKK